MFEDSRTQVFVCDIANADAATYAALPARAGAFYVEPQTFTETAMATNATLYHRFVFKNTAGVLRMTIPFRAADVQNGGYYAGLARQEQVSYLGYNGVAGSMDAANSTYYGLKIILNHTFGLLNNSPFIKTIPYKSDASATQYEVALNLAAVANKQFDREPWRCVEVEAICNRAVTIAQLLDHNAVVVKGSNVINVATNLTYEATAHTLAVGDFLRIGAVGLGTALTSAVYRITEINTLAVTLDRPVQVPSGTYATATVDIEVIEAAHGIAANWGLKFTGVSITDALFNPVIDEPFVVDFSLEAGDFTTAAVTYTTESRIGSGTYQLVSALEARSQFENKTREVSAYPPTVRNIDATAGTAGEGKYNIFAFEVWERSFVDATTGVRPVSKMRYVIAVEHALTEAFHTILGFGA